MAISALLIREIVPPSSVAAVVHDAEVLQSIGATAPPWLDVVDAENAHHVLTIYRTVIERLSLVRTLGMLAAELDDEPRVDHRVDDRPAVPPPDVQLVQLLVKIFSHFEPGVCFTLTGFPTSQCSAPGVPLLMCQSICFWDSGPYAGSNAGQCWTTPFPCSLRTISSAKTGSPQSGFHGSTCATLLLVCAGSSGPNRIRREA